MENDFDDFMSSRVKVIVIIVVSIVMGITVMIIMIQSSLDENIAILEAGLSGVPIIKNEDLQELGRVYSMLNDRFEREIDELIIGKTNRNNKANRELNHYGVYGEDNENPFKNDDYVNGANIKYEKADASIKDGATNFNDIIAVMAVIYDQKMDLVSSEELKETFTDLFWLSHTYTFDSTELYPCQHGCVAENNYKCTDVYKEYNLSRIKYLKYDPFTVKKHDEYEEYDIDEDFRIVYPENQCVVCGKAGAGCKKDRSKICYHGSGIENFIDYDNRKYTKRKTKYDDGESIVLDFEGPIYAELGEIVKGDDISEEDVGPYPTLPSEITEDSGADIVTKGIKVDKNNSSCYYYMEIKYCKERERISKEIVDLEEEISDLEDDIDELNNADSPNESKIEELEEEKRFKEDKRDILETTLNLHISNICEANESASKYWCDGFKLCLGHKTHYKCDGHKIVLCLGHTNINVTIKILYGEELLEEAFKILRE